MAHQYQIVDSIATSPAVLLDFDDRDVFTVMGGSVSPPKLRRNAATSTGDGSLNTESSYEDRVIKLQLNVWNKSAEIQSTAIQELARLLDRREGVWIRWLSEGKTLPVFFRTKRADLDVIDLVLSASPERDLDLEIPCEPFAYGLPETGSFTITNDPTTGTNKMLFSFGTIKGDAATPLHLTFPTATAAHRIYVASQAAFDGTTLTAPYYKSLTAATKNASPPASVTITDTADALFVSGTKRVLNGAVGTGLDTLVIPTASQVQTWDNLPAGDYRVLVRGLTGAVTAPTQTTIAFFNKAPLNGTTYTIDEAALTRTWPYQLSGAPQEWFDLGVAAMPGGAPITDAAFALPGATGTALWNVGVYDNNFPNVHLDAIVLVPAGRPNTVTRQFIAAFPATYTSKAVTFDGITNRAFAVGTILSSSTAVAAEDVAGSMPIVVPNANNMLHFFAHVGVPDPSRLTDTKATTTLVTWKYHPRYIYDRPATT